MMQVGIFTGYFPYGLEETAKKIRAIGFNTVQLDLHFKDIDFSTPEAIMVDKAKRVRDTFRDHDLPVCCVSGYTNIVHPDPAARRQKLDLLKAIIRNARHFGSPYVISETGTFATDSDWVHHPRNKTEEGFAECREVIRELAQVAHDHGAVFLLETYVNNVVGSVEETVRMFAEIDHPGLGLLMDPTNYFDAHNINKMDAVLKQIFDTLSDKIRIGHAKDVKRAESDTSEKHADIGDEDALESHTFRGVGAIELPAPGLGMLNYDLYLRRLAEKHPNIPIIIEHLEEADVPRAKRFLDGKLRANGV
jgi:sugar phosphate isomerase/epimerase